MEFPTKPAQTVLSKMCRSILDVWPQSKWSHTKILVAVSGGPDSVALTRVLLDLAHQFGSPDRLVVAHINHMTRGEESCQDQTFVENLAKNMGLSIEIERVRTKWTAPPSESALRDCRYNLLSKMAHRVGARYIATGHNRDDQIETILFRILRGTGISGLAGIPDFRDLGNGITVVRPLISIDRHDILDLLATLKQKYRVDSSNASSNYTRNFIRNELIPSIQNRFGDSFGNGLLRLGAQANENQALLDSLSHPIVDLFELSPEQIEFDCSSVGDYSPALIRHALVRCWQKLDWPLQDMSARHWRSLSEAICTDEESRPFVLPGNTRVERIGNRFTIVRSNPSDAPRS